MKSLTSFVVCLALFLVPAWADMSFWQEAKITGGMMQGAMKMAGVFSKKAREPMVTEVVKSGNRVARISNQKATITDLDALTVTEVDYKRKRYSSYTFEQMRQYMKQMEEKAKKQAKNREMEFKFTVEGHCDERGTNEYNITLGQSRSSAAVDYLRSLGVNNGMRTISYGEERPVCTESGESCWWRNRRARFIVTGK